MEKRAQPSMLKASRRSVAMEKEMNDWNPALYLRFENERTRPALELISHIAHPRADKISDLGCGPGNSTALLRQAWPQAQITGIDTSEAMLAKAREHLPGCHFQRADIAAWRAEARQDIIYANASLQWVRDHERLIPHLVRQLAPDGVLAIQMPDNLDQPSHRLMREVANAQSWRDKLGDTDQVRQRLLTTEQYYDLLTAQGCDVDIWRTTYYHVMPDTQAIVDWLRATGLRPFLAPLNEEEQSSFLQAYLSQLQLAYPARRDGRCLLAFPRLFMIAAKQG
ncbi:Trans-aconitate 2-methyltransferase [Brenneria goodwinii]|uniref:Trans-aconitate 2-methyltransferase n=2 Tax=Brenneria goodwinii TaxID=1109412 RepID=A0A0G4JRP7_9GAMM|nr:Trans-aconitate 2-methyltransferase [Brenneria goodwinii]